MRRRRRLALALAAPTLLFALGLGVVGSWRLLRPSPQLFAAAPFVYSLADAIESDDVERAVEFIRAGQDPNELIGVRHPVLTRGRSVLVSPLTWAVATQSRRAVLMLLGLGARTDHPPDNKAVCLAEALGNEGIARVLRLYGAPPPTAPCDEPALGDAPLLSLLAEKESISLQPPPTAESAAAVFRQPQRQPQAAPPPDPPPSNR